MNTPKVVGKVGKFNICFRPEQLTSHAGVVLLHDFAQRLGVAGVLDEELSVKTRARGYSEGHAIGGLVYNLILGGEHLSDLEVVRGDAGTQELLGVESVLAPTTAGEFLRKFDMGDVHDLHRVHWRLQQRVRPQQTAPTCTIDLSTPASMSKPPGTKRARPRPTTARWAIIRCWRFGQRKGNCSLATCAGAAHIRPVTWCGSYAKP